MEDSQVKPVCMHRFDELERRVNHHGEDIDDLRELTARMDAILAQLTKVYYAFLTAAIGAGVTAVVAVIKLVG